MTEADRIGIAVKCKVCGMMKKPRGRSAAPASANSLCDYECPGYWDEPRPGDLWPGERASEFGYPVTDDATIAADKSPARDE